MQFLKKQALLYFLYAFEFRGKKSRKYILRMQIRIMRKYKCHIMTCGNFHKKS